MRKPTSQNKCANEVLPVKKMTKEIKITRLNSGDKDLIGQIADWYFDEWNIPRTTTINRLANQPNNDVLFQLVLTKDSKPIATGGLYNNVGLLNDHKKFNHFKPWVALLYTDKHSRNQGIGQMLLKEIEGAAKELKVSTIYLYTFTAETLYKRSGWLQIESVSYKGHDTVIMEKKV